MVWRRMLVMGLAALVVASASLAMAQRSGGPVVKYVRFQAGTTVAYGIVEGDRVRQLEGDLFGDFKRTKTTFDLKEVKLLVPTQPTQVFALAGNYRSHLAADATVTTTITSTTTITTDIKTGKSTHDTKTESETRRSDEVPKKLQIPQPFFKSPSCLIPDGGQIVIPKDAGVVHYEAEMVIVIGKTARKVPKSRALEYVFGVTCGNDISARVWQKGDVQWWRAKGSDTFGPCGPYIVSGLNYDDLLLQLRLNGETKQKERTSHMIHNVSATVSFISKHVTLHPGDLIFTGTSGQTSEIKPGDVVEVELEKVGVLRNSVVAEK